MTSIQIILGLLTIFFSGVVSGVTTYMLNSRKAERDFARGKLEVLWVAVQDFGQAFDLAFRAWSKFLGGEEELIETLRVSKMRLEEANNANQQAIIMLVNIYFRSLKPHLEQMISARKNASRIINPILVAKALPDGYDLKKNNDMLKHELNSFRAAIRNLKEGIYLNAPRWEGETWAQGMDSIRRAFKEGRLFSATPYE